MSPILICILMSRAVMIIIIITCGESNNEKFEYSRARIWFVKKKTFTLKCKTVGRVRMFKMYLDH